MSVLSDDHEIDHSRKDNIAQLVDYLKCNPWDCLEFLLRWNCRGGEMAAEGMMNQPCRLLRLLVVTGDFTDEILSGGLSLHQIISIQSQCNVRQSETIRWEILRQSDNLNAIWDNHMRDSQTILHQRKTLLSRPTSSATPLSSTEHFFKGNFYVFFLTTCGIF